MLKKLAIVGDGKVASSLATLFSTHHKWFKEIALHSPNIDDKTLDQNPIVKINHYSDLKEALSRSWGIVIVEGIHSSPKQTYSEQFLKVSPSVASIAHLIGETSPHAIVSVCSPPLDSIVPMMAEIFKRHRMFDPRRLVGIPAFPKSSVSSIATEFVKCSSEAISIPLIGGSTISTCLPLVSQIQPQFPFTEENRKLFIHKFRETFRLPFDLVEPKLANAVYQHILPLLNGSLDRIGYFPFQAFVSMDAHEHGLAIREWTKNCEYFLTEIGMGKEGIGAILPHSAPTTNEFNDFKNCRRRLLKNLRMGIELGQRI